MGEHGGLDCCGVSYMVSRQMSLGRQERTLWYTSNPESVARRSNVDVAAIFSLPILICWLGQILYDFTDRDVRRQPEQRKVSSAGA
jgi:hypothetical protein